MNAEPRVQSGDIVTLEHIFFSYRTNSGGTRSVLRDVNLSLKPHHRIGLYGPNGSGKTTLLRCITGLNRPSGGRVLFHGREMKGEKDFHDLRVAVGFVLQNADDQLFFPTVLEDVAFGPLNLGMSPDEARERAIGTLKSLGMSGFEDRLTHRLSGGEKKMVTLAGVLAMNPEALLLDEPTAGVDVELRHRIWDFMQELHAHGHTIILTTHYLEEAQSLCDRIALLNGGKLAALDTTKALLSRFSGKRLRFTLRSGSLPTIEDFIFERIGQTNDYAVSYRNDTDILTVLQALQSTTRIDDIHTGESSLEEVFLRLTNSDKRP